MESSFERQPTRATNLKGSIQAWGGGTSRNGWMQSNSLSWLLVKDTNLDDQFNLGECYHYGKEAVQERKIEEGRGLNQKTWNF